MKKVYLSIAAFLCLSLYTYGQANIHLSNLAPTNINTHLLPSTYNLDIGSGSYAWRSWRDLYLSGDIYLDGQKYISNPGGYNSFVGTYAGTNLTSGGTYNTAHGYTALYFLTTGSNNTANGYSALYSLTTGSDNTGSGSNALASNQTGSFNTATGSLALNKNISGRYNCSYGFLALGLNKSGNFNIANGLRALVNNKKGNNNTGVGSYSLFSNDSTNDNSAFGYSAGADAANPSQGTFLGAGTGANPNLYNMTAVGYGAVALSSNEVMLGNTSVRSVKAAGTYVIYSDGRFKKDIREEVPGLAFINKLRPVTYHYNIHDLNKYINPAASNTGKQRDTDNEKMNKEDRQKEEVAIKAKEQKLYTGFIAQEVEKAANMLNYDFSGVYKPANDKDVYGLSYSDFVAPLVKSVQELTKINEVNNATIEALRKELAEQKKMLLAADSANVQEFIKINERYMAMIEALQKKVDELNKIVLSYFSGSKPTHSNAVAAIASLEQNVPNPFASSTTISYNLPQKFSTAQISVAGTEGKMIKQVNISGRGKGSIVLDTRALSPGTYNYSLLINGQLISTKQMISAK